ncbi:MAG: hypothetical protein RMN53_16155 [Anaerolineae bacterium]|nr:hypothetical protein [Anaerolineae bacterium]
MEHRRPVSVVISSLLVFLSAFLFLPFSLFREVSTGLDPSWAIGHSMGVRDGLVAGRDIIWTYGPLGVLATRLSIAVERWHLILWDLYIVASSTLIVIYGFYTLRSLSAKLLLLGVVFVTSLFVTRYVSSLPLIVFVLFCFALFYYIRFGALWALALAGVNALLAFYLKANIGLPALLMLGVTVGVSWLGLIRIDRRSPAVFSLAFLGALVVFSRPLRTDLAGYLVGQVHLANAYNDAMAIPLDQGSLGTAYLTMAITLVAAFALVGLASLRWLVKDPPSALLFGMTALHLYLLFKNGFLRPDEHIRLFFLTAPAALGIVALLVPPPLRHRMVALTALALLFSLSFAVPYFSLAYLQRKLDGLELYVRQATSLGKPTINLAKLEADRLPPELLSLIGTQSVDVIPWEIAMVAANGLRYNPRPVIQSQLAFDGYLDAANADAYRSAGAPDVVLYEPGDIDGRHPFFTESQTKLALLANYQVAARSDRLLVLQRLPEPLVVTEERTVSGEIALGEALEIEDHAGLQMMRAQVDYSLLGKLVRLLFQPARLQVRIEFSDGEVRTYRAIPTILQGGVLINRFVESLEQAEDFFGNRGQGGRTVKKLMLQTDQPWAFREIIPYQIRYLHVGARSD